MFAQTRIENSSKTPTTPSIERQNNFVLHGIAASILLSLTYFLITSIAESFDHAITQLLSLSYLFIPLIASFGIQIALFSYSRQQSREMQKGKMGVTTSGGVSTASMIACCLHHVTDVTALVGLTTVSLFLTTYQPAFILVGILSNIMGIFTILVFLQKNKLYMQNGVLAKLLQINMIKVRKLSVVLGITVIIAAFAGIALGVQPATDAGNTENIILQAKTISQNGLTIQASPEPFVRGDAVKIYLTFETHSGELSLDLTKVARLQDSNGTKYQPTVWNSLPPNEHHLSGTLVFSAPNGEPSSIKLVLTDVYGADWVFEWNLA